jgi:hypothetical protein
MDSLEEAAVPTEQERVDRWRAEKLTGLGFDEHDVELLVAARADVHQATEMLERGCPRYLALEILL